jgi:Tol biopolymer transport system component
VSEIRLVATDKKGNTSTRTFDYKSDLTVPTASAKAARPPLVDGFYGAPVDVTFSGSELSQVIANSGVSYVRYRVDGGAWQQAANNSNVTISTDGSHVIEYHAVDFAGRESGTATLANDSPPPPDVPLTVNLDLRPPVPSAAATPAPNAAGWANDTTTIDLAASDGAGSGVKEIFYSATGAQPIGATTIPLEFASVDITAPGTTTLAYQARDRVGNLSTPKKVTVKLDKTPPAASLASPTEGTVYRSGTISMGGTASDGLSGLARVEFIVDGWVVATDTAAPFSFALDSSTIPDGIRQIGLRATDAAGNQSVSAHTVYVNRTANTYLLGRPPHTTSSTDATFSFSAWNTAATYECSLDGAAFASCTSPKGYLNLALGQHTFRVRSKVGGVLDSTPVVYTWLIEPPVPARTTLASVGAPAASNGPSSSATGRFVAFQTTGALVAGDTNNLADVYVRDRDTDRDGIFDEPGATALVRVSVGTDGGQATGQSRAPAISADGRFVAFASDAANLVAGDTNARRDVFLRDRDIDADGVFDEAGATSTIRVSVSNTGAQGDMNADGPAISGDGRYIGFDSLSTALAPGGNGYFQVYAYDRVTNQLTRVSSTADGVAGAGHSSKPAFSADGRFVAFVSNALNLAGVPSEHFQNDVYVSDRDSDRDGVFDEPGATKIVKMSYSLAAGGPNGYVAYRPAISSTGRFVAFESSASNLVVDDGNGFEDVFVRDRDADRDGIFDEARATTLARVSVSTSGLQANGTSAFPDGVSLSGDGRYVAFSSIAKNLAPEATSGYIQVFLRDRKTGRTSLGSVTSSGGQGSLRSDSPALSSNGGYLAFASDSINMTPDDGTSDLDLFTTKVDLVAPETSVTAGPRFFTAATSGTFSWTATEVGVTFTCSLDHAAYVPCSSPRLVSGLAPGEHVFQVRATDLSGNTDPTPDAREWVVQ